MAWKAVGNTGANGGYVNTDKVWYRIYDVDQSNNDMVAELRDSVQGTSYDIDYDTNAGEQKAIQFGLSASNSAGNSLIVGSDPLIVGQAYTLPFRESLAQCAVSNFWWGDRTGNSAFTLSNENASDGDGGCFAPQHCSTAGDCLDQQWKDRFGRRSQPETLLQPLCRHALRHETDRGGSETGRHDGQSLYI